ncbi:MAG: lytic transglycosylase domain-containing protein [Treponema sp.]|nr:lytic transglycosylase domain-containing protein [Treponema sp.]
MDSLKIETVIPVFAGVLCSLVFCALAANRGPGILACHPPGGGALPAGDTVEKKAALFFAGTSGEDRDLVREMYGEPVSRDWVIDFFAELCGSRETASVILANADAFRIPPALAFALAWEESRFNPNAVNTKNRNESTDRGLFQLNSLSFPDIEVQAFFNPKVNAWYGMGHLRYCLDSGGSEIAALAMYNAGTGRVRSQGAPKQTLDYVHRILEYRNRIELDFELRVLRRIESKIAEGKRRGRGGLLLGLILSSFATEYELATARPE